MTTDAMVTRTEVCYDLLKGRILDHTYGPGSRLVIDQLVRETKISTIPWREAIRRLEAEGWLEIIPHIGARVASFDSGEWGRTMSLLARLEGYATALAAPRLTTKDLAMARATNDDMAAALHNFDPKRFAALARKFHTIICGRSGDAHLLRLLDSEWSRLDLSRRSALTHAPGREVISVIEHDALLNLLENGAEFGVIETAARQHKLNTLAAVVQHEAAEGTPVIP